MLSLFSIECLVSEIGREAAVLFLFLVKQHVEQGEKSKDSLLGKASYERRRTRF